MAPHVLMIALGLHALFEGLAVGINPETDKAAQLMLGIILHKGAAGTPYGLLLS